LATGQRVFLLNFTKRICHEPLPIEEIVSPQIVQGDVVCQLVLVFVPDVINFGVVNQQNENFCLEQVIVVPKGSKEIRSQEACIGTYQVPLSLGLARHGQSLSEFFLTYCALSYAEQGVTFCSNGFQPYETPQSVCSGYVVSTCWSLGPTAAANGIEHEFSEQYGCHQSSPHIDGQERSHC
jgi:hypothetical protein